MDKDIKTKYKPTEYSLKTTKTRFPKKNICQWKKILFEYINNPDQLTVPEFCEKHNVGKALFYKWRRKLYPDFKVVSVNKKSPAKKAVADNEAKFIAVKAVDDAKSLIDSEPIEPITESKSIKAPESNLPDISSPLKISLSNLSLEFTRGCHFSELSKLITFLNAS